MSFKIILGWHMFYTEQWMGGRGRMLIIAPLEVKCPRAKALGHFIDLFYLLI